MIKLKLYVTGETPGSRALIVRLREMLDTDGEYDLQVFDVFENPVEATKDMVLATPTLIKFLPPPVRRLIGELKDRERVFSALRITENGNGKEDN